MTPRTRDDDAGADGDRQPFTWDELRDYWEHHSQREGRLDPATDPDALGNVCWPGQPLWLNRHLAAMQEAAFGALLGLTPTPRADGRALDVGCGSGRWCRVLAAHGFRNVVGIDLQPALIESNRHQMPTMRFERTPLQEFEDSHGFDLISSVTVIQHNPFEHHPALARHMRSLLRDGGHALVLENVRDHSVYTFPHSPSAWAELFEDAGFETIARRPYDFSPFLRAVLSARETLRAAGGGLVRRRPRAAATGHELSPVMTSGGRAMRAAVMMAVRAAVVLDRPLERVLFQRPDDRTSIHCGFLFRAV